MKTEKEIKDKLKFLESLLINKELEDELIMGGKRSTKIRLKSSMKTMQKLLVV